MLVSIDDLLKRGKEREKKKKFKVLVKELDKEIECEAISRKDYLDIVLDNNQDTDVEIIYNSCPVFRDDKLIDRLGCKARPTQVVAKVLKDPTIYKLSDLILVASGYGEVDLVSLAEETKN